MKKPVTTPKPAPAPAGEKTFSLSKNGVRGIGDIANKRKAQVDAELALVGVYSGAVMADYTPNVRCGTTGELTEPDAGELFLAMDKVASEVVKNNNMEAIERLLVNQTIVLNAVFNHMLMNAAKSSQKPHLEMYMRIALRAQAQSRCTAETLSNIKNPRTVFVQQANIANGHQQVNNGIEASNRQTSTHTREIDSKVCQNELLEVGNGNQMDTGAQIAAIRPDTDMATVGMQHRSKDTRGQGKSRQKRLQGQP
jgi:hypothetical protein